MITLGSRGCRHFHTRNGYYSLGECGFRFIKPLESKLRESSSTNNYYYVARLYKSLKHLYKIDRAIHSFYTKEQIDILPKHMRRGGIYGHDYK
jgi:hypothetical protein